MVHLTAFWNSDLNPQTFKEKERNVHVKSSVWVCSVFRDAWNCFSNKGQPDLIVPSAVSFSEILVLNRWKVILMLTVIGYQCISTSILIAVLFRPYGLQKIYHLRHFMPVFVKKWLKIIVMSNSIKPLPNKKIQVFFVLKKYPDCKWMKNIFLNLRTDQIWQERRCIQ